jgi:hypothetical protein
MAITIDELFEQLEIDNVIPKQEYEELKPRRPASYEMQSKWFDQSALPSTKAIAPIICERLKGTQTAVELGYGTGFRLLYYALNNPTTHFTAIDKDASAAEELEKRAKKFDMRNIEIYTGDYYKLGVKHSSVIAIDCFDYTDSPNITLRAGMNYLFCSKMTDTTQRPAFFCTQFYNAPSCPWTEEHKEFYLRTIKEGKLNKLETVPFEFTKNDGQKWSGQLLFGTP